MKCIKEEDLWLKIGLISQPIKNQQYRLSKFVVRLSVEKGFLLYNTATGCLLLFENEQDFQDANSYLISKWFYVPTTDFDEFLWIDFLRDKKRELSKNNFNKSYIIMTTMDCNARCFYCYEKGRKPIVMTSKTAKDISNFIIADTANKKVKFSWFGGEPLVNSSVIDFICTSLQKNGIDYVSNIISNGLLFSEDLIERAKTTWNLKKAQITIDGTEEKYLKTKAFKDGHGDEFKKVLLNIENLLKNNISVSIRLNQNLDNTDDLLDLADLLKNKFANYCNLTAYNRLLFDEEITENTQVAYFRLKQRLRQLRLLKPYFGESIGYSQCMADNDSSLVITPNGKVGKCEHFSETNLVGSIYDNEFDSRTLERFKEHYDKLSSCDICVFYPNCVRLKMCPSQLDVCSEFFRSDLMDNLHSAMKACYKHNKGVRDNVD